VATGILRVGALVEAVNRGGSNYSNNNNNNNNNSSSIRSLDSRHSGSSNASNTGNFNKKTQNNAQESSDPSDPPDVIFQERQRLIDKLYETRPLEERRKKFRELTVAQQEMIFFPDDVARRCLPQTRIPINWEEYQNNAVNGALSHVHGYIKSQIQDRGRDENSTDSEEDMPCSDTYDPVLIYESLARALPYCFPMEVGFHTTLMDSRGNENWCYCPLGRHMKPFRELFGMRDLPEWEVCKFKAKKAPHEFLKHVQQQSTNDYSHRVLWEYLEELFSNYHAKGVRHIAFEDINSDRYKQTRRLILREVSE